MKKSTSTDYKNDHIQLIKIGFSEEIGTLFKHEHGKNYDPSNDIDLIVEELYHIITFALLDSVEKGFGSISNNSSGDAAVRGLKELRHLPAHRYELTKYKKLSDRYTVFVKHENSFMSDQYIEKIGLPDLESNFPHKQKTEPLMSQLMFLNKKYNNIKNEIVQYNNTIRFLKANLAALNKEKAFIFNAFNIFNFLPKSNNEKIYIDLIQKCLEFVQNKNINGKVLAIDTRRKNFIIKNLPKEFSKCNFENLCTINCNCSTVEGYKKCEKSPECKKCGIAKFITEKYHHHDAPFNGYEAVEASDFCLSLVGIKVKNAKKEFKKPILRKSHRDKKSIKIKNVKLPVGRKN